MRWLFAVAAAYEACLGLVAAVKVVGTGKRVMYDGRVGGCHAWAGRVEVG